MHAQATHRYSLVSGLKPDRPTAYRVTRARPLATRVESGGAMLPVSGLATMDIMRTVARRPHDVQTNMPPMTLTQL